MLQVGAVSLQVLAKGTRSFGPVAVPVGATSVECEVSRSDLLDPTVGIAWALMLSLDGGTSWWPWGGAGTIGGAQLDALGQPITQSTYRVEVPEPENLVRQIEGTVTVSKDATLAVSITFRP